MGKLEKAGADTDRGSSNGDVAPPSYDALATSVSPAEVDQPNWAFSSLNVPLTATEVTVDTCLAHLKLLFAFQNLKEAVGYNDGLWQIYDSRLFPNGKAGDALPNGGKLDGETTKKLSLLREKRWALYVARAADRYQAWWNSFPKYPLTEADMCDTTPKYEQFVSSSPPEDATPALPQRGMLPPLDVLMVWHAHMLNPRAYLEDCIRHGLQELWHSGLPWKLINDAIDINFNYEVSPGCKAAWETTTRRRWENEDDPSTKILPACPQCGKSNTVPWSTCGMAEGSHDESPPTAGQGYGDSGFETKCIRCGKVLKRDYLEVSKFTKDVANLLAYAYPMPGTILNSKTGMTERLPHPLYKPPPASMDAVRDLIGRTLANPENIKRIESVAKADRKKRYILNRTARTQVRIMMSRYWGNSSPFALELGGAVLRQGIFTEKMYKMDWLHSPAARETMTRLIEKYKRFTAIMGSNPDQVAVPTLDVDLAWHTHQLSPASYYEWMTSQTKTFIDHDDKIEECKLSNAFEWTSKVYQELYGEVYSECTCWYCESVRASHTSSLVNKLSILQGEKDKAPDKFYESGRAALCPPDNSAHISAHNAARVTDSDPIRSSVHERMQAVHRKRLESNYDRARRRARKKGREPPPRDDHLHYYYYWGAPFLLAAPFVYPAYLACPTYYNGNTADIPSGSGYYGACAGGTCSGTAASGACGAGTIAGGCGAGGGGSSHVGCGSGGSSCGGGGSSGCGGGCGGGGGGGGC